MMNQSNTFSNFLNQSQSNPSPVLLVCIYNKASVILTHQFFFAQFSPFGTIIKILIFDKAKFSSSEQAQLARSARNNSVVFEDGSKMNIFHAKLRKIEFQNTNLGGISYQNQGNYAGQYQQQSFLNFDQEKIQPQCQLSRRHRSSTVGGQQNKLQEERSQYYNLVQQYPICQVPINYLNCFPNITQGEQDDQSLYNNASQNQSSSDYASFEQINQNLWFNERVQESTFQVSKKKNKKSTGFSLCFDIDEQFHQLALENEQYKELWKANKEKSIANDKTLKFQDIYKRDQKSQNNKNEYNYMQYHYSPEHYFYPTEEQQIQTRKKSSTVSFAPISNQIAYHTEQFIQQNIPSKVLFVRSVPDKYTPQCIYNIFVNFGEIKRIIYIGSKNSALIEFESIEDAIQAKDQINYCKSQIKVFYSHYSNLDVRSDDHDQGQVQFTPPLYLDGKSITYNGVDSSPTKSHLVNPPSDTLYLTQLNEDDEDELKRQIFYLNCTILAIQWKCHKRSNSNQKSYKGIQHKKNRLKDKRWSCLIKLKNINESLMVMGFLQGMTVGTSTGYAKQLKISFTRSKICLQRGFQLQKYREKREKKTEQKQQTVDSLNNESPKIGNSFNRKYF